MTALVADNLYSGGPTNAVAKVADEQLRDFIAELPGASARETLTIAAGVVTPTVAAFTVDTEGAAATDDLDTIAQTNHPAGRIIFVSAADPARVVTLKNAAGNLANRDGKDLVLRNTSAFTGWVAYMRVGTTWMEVARNLDNGLRTVRALTANTTLVASDSGTTITNTGAPGDLNHPLPAATVGMELRVRVTAAHKIKLTADGTDTITDDDGTTVSGAGGNTEIAATVGDAFDIECFEAGKWVVTYARGTLTTT